MAATPFRAINWAPNELIGEDKMDQLANNTQWLYENTPRTLYTLPGGLKRPDGIRISSGKALITRRNAANAAVNVYFSNFFSARCEPVVTTGIVSNDAVQVFAVINGLGSTLNPTSSGFQVQVRLAASPKIKRSFYVSWHAMGY